MPGYLDVAERGWRWTLEQVQWSDGPWIAERPGSPDPPPTRDGVHSGVGGLALALGELRLHRPWTEDEARLAAAIADRVRARVPSARDASIFDGLSGDLATLTALQEEGAELVVARLTDLAEEDGWPTQVVGPPRYAGDARINDLVLGTAGVLLAGVEAVRQGVPGGRRLAEHAAEVLMGEAECTGAGRRWRFVPERFRVDGVVPTEMPNLSHGQAGVVAVLAAAGVALERPDLVTAAVAGAEHLLSLADHTGTGVRVPRYLPPLADDPDPEPFSLGWCHGAAGTSLAFAAIGRTRTELVAGRPPADWRARFLLEVRSSGIPERLRPGFWDNDGRCCGTAGVGGVMLHSGTPADLDFARVLGDALVARAQGDEERAWWRFAARDAGPEGLPPGPGWMQGAAGIAAYLLRLHRVLEEGAPGTEPALDWWWALS